MKSISIKQEVHGNEIFLFAVNTSDTAETVNELCVFSSVHSYNPNSKIYGEGFQMLSQYDGTVEEPHCITQLSDAGHYKFPMTDGYHTVYNLLLIQLENGNCDLFAFSSCHRFNGKILFNNHEIKMMLDLEGMVIKPSEKISLEHICLLKNIECSKAQNVISTSLNRNHNVELPKDRPAGWCSWYCFGAEVTVSNILDNLEVIRENASEFKYIQIDDGYQSSMGDWLSVSKDFGDLKEIIKDIEKNGCKPAIWVAPFIAEKDSILFKEHPQYFVQDESGKPLPSDTFTFGGWRKGPWYMLDGTNPAACEYLTHVFSVMSNDMNIKYFKLDANCWGAFSNGVRYDENATSVEAYRRGMEAVWRGAGRDAVILGCNAPMWPSVGAVNAMRISGDLCRDWNTVKTLQKEILYREWMHNILWMNDPDVFTLRNRQHQQLLPDGTLTTQEVGNLTDAEIRFHKTLVFATGGMMLCGDDMSEYNDQDIKQALLFLDSPFRAAEIDCFNLNMCKIKDENNTYVCLFNDSDRETQINLNFDGDISIKQVWNPEFPEVCCNQLTQTIPPHDAALLKLSN